MAPPSNQPDRFSPALQFCGAAHPLSAASWSAKFPIRSGAPARRCVPSSLREFPPAFSGVGSVPRFAALPSESARCATECPRTRWFRPWCPTRAPFCSRPPRKPRRFAAASCSAPLLPPHNAPSKCPLPRRQGVVQHLIENVALSLIFTVIRGGGFGNRSAHRLVHVVDPGNLNRVTFDHQLNGLDHRRFRSLEINFESLRNVGLFVSRLTARSVARARQGACKGGDQKGDD